MELSEADIRRQIIDFLNYERYIAWTNNTGAFQGSYTNKKGITRKRFVRFSQPGFSDIFAIQPKTGLFVALEVKTPKRRKDVTRQQQDFIDLVNKQGGIGAIVTSIDEVAELLGIKL